MTIGRPASEPMAPPEPTRAAVARRRRLPDETGVALALLVLVVVVGLLKPNFLQPLTLFQQLSGAAFIGMLALGMVFVVVIRDIDLSIGWMFNFSAVIAAKLMVAGVDPWIAAAAGVAFGGFLGLINGGLAVALRIPVIIVTLGTLSMYRGLSLVVNESRAVVPPDKIELVLRPVRHQAVRAHPERRDHLPRRRVPDASAAPSNALRLSGPGHGQQPRGSPARWHPGRPHADPRARPDGRSSAA